MVTMATTLTRSVPKNLITLKGVKNSRQFSGPFEGLLGLNPLVTTKDVTSKWHGYSNCIAFRTSQNISFMVAKK